MYPKLFSIGPISVYGYGLMIAIGIISAVWLAMRRCPARGLDRERMFDLGFFGVLAGIVGAKLLYYIVELPAIIKDPSILLDITSGFVVYGGIIAGIISIAGSRNCPSCGIWTRPSPRFPWPRASDESDVSCRAAVTARRRIPCWGLRFRWEAWRLRAYP